MQTYNCMIVEDEPIAAEILEDYIRQVPYLQLKATCNDGLHALQILQKETIDVIFLDIHLPRLKGLDFIKTLKNRPQVIITSAYQEYALQGFELNVVDYLLKPIEFNRFLMAVNKLHSQDHKPASDSVVVPTVERPYLFFNVNKKKIKLYLDEILYIESLREYIRVTTKDKKILTKFQLGQVEELIMQHNFLRVHRSFIVAKDKIDAFNATQIEINGEEIPIGRSYKELVLRILE